MPHAAALATAAAAAAAALPAFAQSNARDAISAGDWPTINRDLESTRFSPLTEIDASNVGGLSEAWTYELGGNSTAVPLVVNGRMYLPSRTRVVALDAETGEELWAYTLPEPDNDNDNGSDDGGPGPGGGGPLTASTRGVGYWPGDSDHAPRILFTAGPFLVALDAETGDPIRGFGDAGMADIGVPYRGTPTIYEDVAIVGANVGEVPQGQPGNPRGFDVVTGEQLWEFWTVPRPGQQYNDTWGDGWRERSGTNMWAFAAAVDSSRGIAYLPIAGPAPNYYGGTRPGRNVFGNSIVAVDARTGEYRWHFQTVHHDLWDIDLPAVGALFEADTDDGGTVPALAHVGKSSLFYVLNRRDGEPVIDIEERPVPEGDVPDEWYSPTQPFPVAPPPLSRMSFDVEEDLVRAEDTNADHVAACRRYIEESGGLINEGPFTPFMYKAPDDPPRTTIQFPGGTGGINWGGIAMDPRSGIAYVNAQETSLVGWVEDKEEGVTYSFESAGSDQAYDRASIRGKGPFFSFAEPLSGEYEDGRPVGPTAPCYRPPWAELVAVDANTGEILWESTLGINEDLPEDKQRVGNSGSAGPTVTAGGLVFVGATRDERFRAFDAETGEELWVAQIGNNANANPMTYAAGAESRQHVAVVAGDRVVAFRLP